MRLLRLPADGRSISANTFQRLLDVRRIVFMVLGEAIVATGDRRIVHRTEFKRRKRCWAAAENQLEGGSPLMAAMGRAWRTRWGDMFITSSGP